MERVRVGDQVVVVRGVHKGRSGRVSRVLPERGAVIVEGVNVVKRHVKPTPQQAGGIVEVAAPLDLSKVMLVDPETNKPTRVRIEVKDGKKVRVAVKSGAVIAAEQG